VRVSLLCIDWELTDRLPRLDGVDVAFQGPVKLGAFDIDGDLARRWLQEPSNPDGKHNCEVVRPLLNGFDITRRPTGRWIIDFGSLVEVGSSLIEQPFQYARTHVKPSREQNRRKRRRLFWWQHGETGPGLKRATERLARSIFTPRVAEYRPLVWAPTKVVPDSAVVAIDRDGDSTFGILHSRFHELWSLRIGTSLEDRPRYTPSTTFETFPFPEGLTPDIPASAYASDPLAQAIAPAAAELDRLRQAWLDPPDPVRREPEVVPGYPDRLLPVDDKAAEILKKRRLTNLYDARPAWLDTAHARLDAGRRRLRLGRRLTRRTARRRAILARPFALNQARAAAPPAAASAR
jgi:hypothetical protein